MSVQFSCSVVSHSLRPHESQHTRPPCRSPTPRIHSNSSPSSRWCHRAISSSLVPFSCPQFLPASESFPKSQLFAWGGQSTGVSALASFLPKKSQGWSPSEWTLRSLLQHDSLEASILQCSAFFTYNGALIDLWAPLIYHWTTTGYQIYINWYLWGKVSYFKRNLSFMMP